MMDESDVDLLHPHPVIAGCTFGLAAFLALHDHLSPDSSRQFPFFPCLLESNVNHMNVSIIRNINISNSSVLHALESIHIADARHLCSTAVDLAQSLSLTL